MSEKTKFIKLAMNCKANAAKKLNPLTFAYLSEYYLNNELRPPICHVYINIIL